MKTKTFVIDGVKVELTKDEVQERYNKACEKNNERIQQLKELADSAYLSGKKDLAREYRKEYSELQFEISFYAFNLINWN